MLKSSQIPSEGTLSRKVFLEIASYSVMLLGDEAMVKSLEKPLGKSKESVLGLIRSHFFYFLYFSLCIPEHEENMWHTASITFSQVKIFFN